MNLVKGQLFRKKKPQTETELPQSTVEKQEESTDLPPASTPISEQAAEVSISLTMEMRLARRTFTARQYAILLMIYGMSGTKGYAVIEKQNDFELVGVDKTKIKASLLDLEKQSVIEWKRQENQYRILDEPLWKVPIVSGYSDQRIRGLLEGNGVAETSTKLPKQQLSYQNSNFVAETSTFDELPKWEPPEFEGLPNQQLSCQNSNLVAKTATIVEFPKQQQSSQNGNFVAETATDAHSSSSLFPASKDKDLKALKEKDLNNNHHDDECQAFRNEYQQYQSVWKAYESIFGTACNPQLVQFLTSYMDDGMEFETVVHYMTKARLIAKPYSYAKKCIENAYQKGIRTLENAVADDKEFESKRTGHAGAASGGGIHLPNSRKSYFPGGAYSEENLKPVQDKYDAFYEAYSGQRESAATK